MKYRYSKSLYEETRYRRIIQLLMNCSPRDKVVVDLGAGSNPIGHYVKCSELITIDFNKDNDADIVCDLNNGIPLKDKSCDIIVAGEILEHVYYSKRFLLEIRRALRPGGYLILSVPNVCFIFYRIAWMFGIVPPYAAKADYTYSPPGEAGGHVRDYSFKELINILLENEFKILKTTTNGIIYKRFYIPYYLSPKTLGQKIIVLAQTADRS